MNSYKYLRVISKFFKIAAYISLIGGILYTVVFTISMYNMSYYFGVGDFLLTTIPMALGSIILFIFLMAISQVILLAIDIADKINNIDNNVYVIAKDTEERQES